MNRRLGLLPSLALALAPAMAAGDSELAALMQAMQTFTHKLQLSLEHGNPELARFYLHELEESLAEVNEIAEYDGRPIGQLSSTMLSPALERLEAALSDTAGDAAGERELDALLGACNACHAATAHGFIVIGRNPANPYAQSFEPR